MFIILLFAGGIFLITTYHHQLALKTAGEKAGKEICEKIKSGIISMAHSEKVMKEFKENVDDPADFKIWLEGFSATSMSCMN